MKKIIYIIKKTMFDNFENSIGNARYYELIGWSEDLKKINSKIKRLNKDKKYKGWDNIEYPLYDILEIKELKVLKN